MDELDSKLILLLQFLLPGFLTAWVFHALSSYPKQSQFERVVQALIFTILVQGLSYIVTSILFLIGKYVAIGEWKNDYNLVNSLLCAFIFGLVLTYFSNNDKFHKLLRKYNITRETSYASEWFGTFSSNIMYVVLHLEDGRRILGWPTEWPTEAKKGHFVLMDASWLDEDNKEIRLEGVKNILIDAVSVRMVEFMNPLQENSHE